jgi:hypothetical protein
VVGFGTNGVEPPGSTARNVFNWFMK